MMACPSVRISTAHDPLKGQHRRNNPMKHCTYSSSCSSLMSSSVQPFYPQSTVIQHKDPEKLKSLADKCWKYEIAKSCCVNYIMLSIYQVKRKLNFSCSYEINIWCTMQTWSNNQKSLSNPPQIFTETRKKKHLKGFMMTSLLCPFTYQHSVFSINCVTMWRSLEVICI